MVVRHPQPQRGDVRPRRNHQPLFSGPSRLQKTGGRLRADPEAVDQLRLRRQGAAVRRFGLRPLQCAAGDALCDPVARSGRRRPVQDHQTEEVAARLSGQDDPRNQPGRNPQRRVLRAAEPGVFVRVGGESGPGGGVDMAELVGPGTRIFPAQFASGGAAAAGTGAGAVEVSPGANFSGSAVCRSGGPAGAGTTRCFRSRPALT